LADFTNAYWIVFMTRLPFTDLVIDLIKSIPAGKVATYGGIARMAGKSRGARQVAYILHSFSAKEGLPWHRVVNRAGCISLRPGFGYEEQKDLLISEGVVFDEKDTLDFGRFLWIPGPEECQETTPPRDITSCGGNDS